MDLSTQRGVGEIKTHSWIGKACDTNHGFK